MNGHQILHDGRSDDETTRRSRHYSFLALEAAAARWGADDDRTQQAYRAWVTALNER